MLSYRSPRFLSPKDFRFLRKYKLTSVFVLRPEALFPEEQPAEQNLYIFLKSGEVVPVPARVTARDLREPVERILERYPMPIAEEQSICIAGTFWVAAFNGVDLKRKIHFQVGLWLFSGRFKSPQGFCQSPEALGECVEDVVLDRGGEIVHAQQISKDDGLLQSLKMTVSVPYLFGVPPEFETIRTAIELGGGLLHRVYGQWYFY